MSIDLDLHRESDDEDFGVYILYYLPVASGMYESNLLPLANVIRDACLGYPYHWFTSHVVYADGCVSHGMVNTID